MSNLVLNGVGYRLRRAEATDAEFVLELRASETERTKYLNAVPNDLELQQKWILRSAASEQDFYFVIEDRLSNKAEGLIGLYDFKNESAEWGRWILRPGSSAAVESIYLLAKFAFENLGLQRIYSRTLADNLQVIKFHDSMGAKRSPNSFELSVNGKAREAIEHTISKTDFEHGLRISLLSKVMPLAFRGLKKHAGDIEFHHVGIATRSIENESSMFAMLGYKFESETFIDTNQGIRGIFMVSPGQPRIELLENLEGSQTLDHWLRIRAKAYHFAYYVPKLDLALAAFGRLGARVIQPPKVSPYFGGPIAFVALANMFIIELIENVEAHEAR